MRQLRDRGRAPLPAQSFLHLRGEPLHPAIDRAMVNRDAAFSHHRFEIAVTDRVPTVPTHSPEYDLTVEVTSLEVVHAPSPHPSRRREFTTPAELCNRAAFRPHPVRYGRVGSRNRRVSSRFDRRRLGSRSEPLGAPHPKGLGGRIFLSWQWQPKNAHFSQSKTAQSEGSFSAPSELCVTGLAQRPPRVW